MFWRTGCIGFGPTCGGRRGRSEPERAGGEQAGTLGLLPRRRGWLERRRSRQSALRQVPWPLGCRATGRALSASRAWWRFRAYGTDATPATAATSLRRPPHQQNHRSRLWRPVAAVAAFCVPTTPAAPGNSTPPRWPVPPNSRPCRSGVRGSLAFSFHLGRCSVPVPQEVAALCAGARTRAGTPRTPGGLHALRPKGLLCPAADTAGPSWRSGGSPQRQQRRSGSRSNGAPQPEVLFSALRFGDRLVFSLNCGNRRP